MNRQARFEWPVRPASLAESQLLGKHYRLTVLTEGLLRLEYSESGVFEDRATGRVISRLFPKADFDTKEEEGRLILSTAFYELCYQTEAPFCAESLRVSLKVKPYTEWRFGEKLQNLKGTARTLDHTDGAVELSDGVCSRDGLALIDDSDGFALASDSDGQPGWPVERIPEKDFYLFAYGHHYREALKAYYALTGMPPMLPGYALGNWWSRYHAYTQEEYLTLIRRFEAEKVPLSVAVIDMDWHHVHDLPENAVWPGMLGDPGWTGYSWNRALFPDPDGFLKTLHEKGLKTSLNLHPAQGVRFFEDVYPELAKKRGIDPESRKPVKLDLLDPSFMEDYFDVVHHPMEEKGVDFWWMDWQQGTDYWWIRDEEHPAAPMEEKVDPLWMLNHLHILDFKGKEDRRPMFFSRYAGVGSQRYPIGFSGDSAVSWASLTLQPYFTLTASNIGYCWWSHDIGGHLGGIRDGELATRWVQLGVFSPILRLHSNSSIFTGKEPWKYRKDYELVQERFLRLRHRLFPYLYTMNYRSHREGLPLVQPMYYAYPERYEAYENRNQFLFGSELLVAPITERSDEGSGMGRTTLWLPEGTWFDCFSGLRYESDGTFRTVYRSIDEYPVFAPAGAIVPMQESLENGAPVNGGLLSLYVFPGRDASFTLYEDAGDGDAFEAGAFAETPIRLCWGETKTLTVESARGDIRFARTEGIRVLLRGVSEKLTLGAASLPCSRVSYDADTQTLEMLFEHFDPAAGLSLTLQASDGFGLTRNAHATERALRVLTLAKASADWKDQIWRKLMAAKDRYSADAGPGDWHTRQAVRELLLLADLGKIDQ